MGSNPVLNVILQERLYHKPDNSEREHVLPLAFGAVRM